MASMIHDMLNPWSASKIPSLTGRVAVVTGGNEGIAAALIAELFKHDIAKVCPMNIRLSVYETKTYTSHLRRSSF